MATILIVDDHILNRQFLIALLGFDNHTLLAAADGVEGLAAALAHHPDLIISDLRMPNMDGPEFVKCLRADAALAATPVIFYTSTYGSRAARAMARDCGVRWILQKPAAPDVILRAVREALGMPPAPLSAAQAPAPAKPKLTDYLQQLDASRQWMSELAGGGAPPQLALQLALKLAQSLADLQDVGLRLTALIDMGIEMSVERDPARLLETACRIAQHLGVARYAVVGIGADDGGVGLRHMALRGLDQDERARLTRLGPELGMLDGLMAGRVPLRRRAIGGDPRMLGLPPGHPSVDSFLGVPIASAGRLYGWLYLVDKLGADEFSEVDERAVATVATQLAAAYENLVLYNKVQDTVRQLEAELRERRRMTDRLHASEAGLQRAQLIAGMAHVVSGADGRFESWSATLPQLIGRAPDALPRSVRDWMELVAPVDRPRFCAAAIAAARAGVRTEVDYAVLRADGTALQVRQVFEPLPELDAGIGRGEPVAPQEGFGDTDGRARGQRWFTTIQDISEQRAQRQKITRLSQIYAVLSGINSAIVHIRQRDELLREACRVAVSHGAFSLAWAGVIDPDTFDGKVLACCGGDPLYSELIRFSARDDGPGSDRPASIAAREKRHVVCNDIAAEASMAPLAAELMARGVRSLAALPLVVERRVVAVIALFADEIDFFAQPDRIKLLDELAGDLSFGLQFIEREDRRNYLAYYDGLTGLPNSMLFHDRMGQFVHAAGAAGLVAVVVINLDHFVQLNEALGRQAGDATLQMVARRLADSLQEPFTLARIGADTFAIAFGGLQRGADALALLEQQVLAPLGLPFQLDGQELRVSVRAGIALYPADGSDADTLFKRAEVALKKAKSSSERYLFYAPRMNAAIAERVALEHGLRQALDGGQFTMHYQARVDLENGRIVGAEALIRWQHTQRGLVSPAEFIPVAEESGLIVPIGDWVIEAVCAQQAQWQAQQVPIVPVAINLSALQFKNGKVQHTIRAAMARHQLAPSQIEFELTESVVMDQPEQAVAHLRELKSLGVQLSLDDFGTGYSSLAYLKRFPFDFVKIDRAFITDIGKRPEDAAIATAVIAMAHSLGLRVVAEGVETAIQLEILRRQRCDELQGYYFSRPVAADAFAAMLRADRRLALPPLPERRLLE